MSLLSPACDRVVSALADLPDEPITQADLVDVIDADPSAIRQAIKDLIRIGELELCRDTPDERVVWLKHRQPTAQVTARQPLTAVWHAYVAPTYHTRIAERSFRSRETALTHLAQTLDVSEDAFEPVECLDAVWVAVIDAAQVVGAGDSDWTADVVVRREYVYGVGAW